MGDESGTREKLIEALDAQRALIPPGIEPRAIESEPWFRTLDADPQFRQLLELMSAVIMETDERGRIIWVSSTIESVAGRRPEEVIGRRGPTTVHTDDLPVLIEHMKSVGETGRPKPAAYRLRHKAGHWIWMETSSETRFIASDETVHSLTFSRDVTELKQAQDELAEAENRYRVIVESGNDIVFEADEEGRALFVSTNAEAVLGYKPEQILAMGPFEMVHPDDVPIVNRGFHRAIEKCQPTRIEPYRVRHADGSWRWLETTGISYRHKSGETRFLNVTRDITTTLEDAERRRELEEAMQQAQRLESLGVMAGGIAHDFNNLLTPILGDASLVLADLPADSPLRSRLARIQNTARRAAELTRQMLAYAGAEEIDPVPLDLSAVVRETARLLESAVSGKTEVVYELEPGLPSVLGERAQLTQVSMNLLTNAAEAMQGHEGRIAIRTGTAELTEATGFELPEGPLPPGRYVFLEVEDSGCGMDPDTRRRIFDPFFTTKFTGRGLGLASVLGILRAHRGAVEIDTSPGRGTRFRVLFPPEGSARKRDVAALLPREDSGRRNATILVIDDDDGTREVTADCLDYAGYRVLTASDGCKGVELYRQHADTIELVILDRTMPRLSGEETLDRIRAVDGRARVLLMSGYAEKRAAESFAGKNLSGFIHKPFLPEDLVAKVQNAIADSDA